LRKSKEDRFAMTERTDKNIQSRPTIGVNAAMMAMDAVSFTMYHKRVGRARQMHHKNP